MNASSRVLSPVAGQRFRHSVRNPIERTQPAQAVETIESGCQCHDHESSSSGGLEHERDKQTEGRYESKRVEVPLSCLSIVCHRSPA